MKGKKTIKEGYVCEKKKAGIDGKERVENVAEKVKETGKRNREKEQKRKTMLTRRRKEKEKERRGKGRATRIVLTLYIRRAISNVGEMFWLFVSMATMVCTPRR
jgi:hypothetical protein